MHVLGVDIGGSGVKAAVVDTATGKLVGERLRYDTPQPATPDAVCAVIAQLVSEHGWNGPIGCGFPGVVNHGVIATAHNLDKSWVGVHLAERLSGQFNTAVTVINDADAAGVAESQFGAGRGVTGPVILVTVGTGLGTALITNGMLWPNSELGHMIIRCVDVETWASDRVRKAEGLKRKEWAKRFRVYAEELHRLLNPELIIIGGGASKRFEAYASVFPETLPIVPATLQNQAGIIGAAFYARQ